MDFSIDNTNNIDQLFDKPYLSKDDSKMLKAYVVTISKQMEKLNQTVDNINQQNKKTNISHWGITLFLIPIILLCSYLAYWLSSQQQSSVHNAFYQQTDKRIINLEKSLAAPTTSKKDVYIKDRTYIMSKLKDIEKNISAVTLLIEEQKQKPKKIQQPEQPTIQQQTFASRMLDKIENSTATKNAHLYAKLGWLYTEKNEFQKAIEEYEKALLQDPHFGAVYYNLACLYVKLGQKDEALNWLTKGKPYFDQSIINAAKNDSDLSPLRQNAYFSFLMFGEEGRSNQ